MSDWGAWDLCSVSCGTGTTSRTRSITKAQELWLQVILKHAAQLSENVLMELMTIHFFVACSEPEYSNFGSAKAFGGAACPNLTETHSCSPGDVCALPKTLHGWGTYFDDLRPSSTFHWQRLGKVTGKTETTPHKQRA